MKLWVLSDLHLTHGNFQPIDTDKNDYDVVIIAGDTMENPYRTLEWVEQNFPYKEVIVISGNHEYYNNDIILSNNFVYDFFKSDRIHYLSSRNPSIIINDVKFIGSTLWTDFNLYNNPDYSMFLAMKNMNDYYCIKYNGNKLKPHNILTEHKKDLEAITQELNTNIKTVLITHHCIHPKSINEKYLNDPINPCYTSNLENLILDYKPCLAISGHTHNSNDFKIGDTRIIINPKGYGKENKNFNPRLIVEI